MGRREFLGILFGLSVSAGVASMMDLVSIGEFVNRVRGRLKKPAKIPPDLQRAAARMPSKGLETPLELALNSRCTCDYDGHQELFHWGLFDEERTLTAEQVGLAVARLRIPRFLDRPLPVRSNGRRVTFAVDRRTSDELRDWLMIESGMQQQAMCLLCSARGVGMVFHNLGTDGRPVSATEHGTVQMELDAMKPSYGSSYWTDDMPMTGRPWVPGGLPNPDRRGTLPLTATLVEAETHHQGKAPITGEGLGQVLWAARGRTPHLYKSRHWGLTIPTWGGKQDVTRVHLLAERTAHVYLNWADGSPTHTLSPVLEFHAKVADGIRRVLQPAEKIIVIERVRTEAYALWETGGQLLNMILQAHNLNLTYRAVLLNAEQRAIFRQVGIEHAAAAIGFQ